MPRFIIIVGMLLSTINAGASPPDTLLGPPPGTYRITAPDGVAKIPFELFRDDIRMLGEINGQEVRLLIDNGYLWDRLLFFGSPRVDALGFKPEGEALIKGSGTGNAVSSYETSGISLRFPGVEFFDQTALVTPYEPGAPNLWEGAEGQVSGAFLKHFVVDVDFDEMVITLIPPDDFHYEGSGVEVPLVPLGSAAWAIPAVVELADEGRFELNLALDLGDGGAISVQTGGPHDLPIPERALEASLGFGMQGEIFGHYGRVRSVQIGGYLLEDVLATFSPMEHGGYENVDAVVGMGIFSRFNIVFDYLHHRAFFEPNQRFGETFEFNMSGMRLVQGSSGLFTVVKIYPFSPASEAGLREGDRIARVDGIPSAKLRSWEVRPLLRGEGKILTLEVLRDGSPLTVTLVLRRVI